MTDFEDDRRRGRDRRSGKDRRRGDERNHSGPQVRSDGRKADAEDKTVKLSLRFADIWYEKGRGFLDNQQYPEAEEALHNALRIRPNLAEGQYALAKVYSMEGKRLKALYHLERAIEIDEHLKTRAKRGHAFKELWGDGDFKKLVA